MLDSSVVRARFPGIGSRVFLFVVGAILGIAVLVVAVGYKQGAFTRQVRVLFYTPDAGGINKGMPVKLLGFHVGVVKDMHIRRGEVGVELTIAADYAVHVPSGSRARIGREGIIGASYVEIIPRRDSGAGVRSVADNEVIQFDPSTAIADVADEMKREVQPVVASVRETMNWLNDPNGEVRQTIASTRDILETFSQTQRRVDALFGEASATASEVRQSIGPIRESVAESVRLSGRAVSEELPRIAATVSKELPQIAATTTSALGEVAAAARELNRATRATGERLIGASERVTGTIQDAQNLVLDVGEITEAVKRAWPIRTLLDSSGTHTLPIDINESGFPLPPAPSGRGAGEATK